jgi:hypothetical protein
MPSARALAAAPHTAALGAALPCSLLASGQARALAVASGLVVTPGNIPQVMLYDVSADCTVAPQVRLLAGVAKPGDRQHDARVFFVNGGAEPGHRRTVQAGAAVHF